MTFPGVKRVFLSWLESKYIISGEAKIHEVDTELINTDRTKVAACAKHFVGDGGTLRGMNANDTVINSNGLLNIHMPAYYDAVNKGVATVMVSYSSLNGLKMHANKKLITGFLKKKLKFKVTTNHRINA